MDYKLRLSKGIVESIRERHISQGDLTKLISDYVSQHTPAVQNTGVIDLTPSDNGRFRTQNGWIDYHNKAGKATMSASDFYRAHDSILSSLREDIRRHWLVTGTRISYNPNDLGARITQYYGSTVVTPKETSLIVQVYRNELVEKVAKTKEGLRCLQVLFDTEDNASKLIGRLEKISEKEAKDIKILTPDQDSRRNYPERAVGLGCGVEWFRVYGVWIGGGYVGLARGASIKSAKPTVSKK